MNGDSHIPRTGDSEGRAPRRDLVRVGLLGLNAWLVAYLIPSLHVEAGSPTVIALATLPLATLVVGLWALSHRRGLAGWVLVAAYPPALGALIAVRSELVSREAYDAVAMSLATASLLAYLAAAAHATGRPSAEKPRVAHALVGKEPVVEPAARRWLRRVLLALAGGGAFAVAVLAPAFGDRRARTEAWGEGADDGAVLTAVVAAVFAALAVGAIVGPGLRAERGQRKAAARSRRRLTAALVVAAAAGGAWMLLRHFDRSLG